MKLTRSGDVRGGKPWIRCWIALAAGLFLVLEATGLAIIASAQVTTTTVQGTVYLANGQAGSGTLVVSWPAFTTAAGQLITADSLTVAIPSDGFVSVNLAPNQGATPAGEYYTAVFYMSDGSTSTQYWVVPAAAQATIAQVQAQIMPAAQAVQAVSKTYVDQSIQQATQSLLTATGGTLTGPLILSGDPTQPLQAADKHYVDTQVATVDSAVANAWPSLVVRVDQLAGANFGAQLQACLNEVSATYGGTCDARNFTGSQTTTSNVTISTANTTVLLPCATIATAFQIVVTAGTRNASLRGCAQRGGSQASGSEGGTVLAYSGAAAAIQVGDPTYATDTPGFHLDNIAINTTGSTTATAQGLVAYRTQELEVESVYFLGNQNQTAMTLDGTGNYTGGTFLDDQFDGFGTAVNAIGHQVSNPATTDWVNASTFIRLHIDCPTSSGNPIAGTYGINLQQGDGNTFTGGDVEGCATALHLGANAQNNTIVGLRNENSTDQVVADAGSEYNSWITGGTMFTGKLIDNGTRNSFLDAFHRSFNALNGDQWRSQADATVTNHIYTGIGLGNVRGRIDEYTTDVPGSPGNYQNAWQWGPGDGTSGQQIWSLTDMLNNVQRFGVQENTAAGGAPQSYLNAAGTGLVCFNCSTNSGTGGVSFGSGGASPATVATINNAGNAQFNGTLQVNGTAQFAGTTTVRNNANAEVDYYLWPGLTTSQKGSFTYKDWNGASQWYMVKDASNNWALNSATGGLDSFKAYQSTNSGDTYIDTSNSTGVVRVNYETGSGTQFKVYGGNSNTLYAAFTGATAIQFPGLASSSGYDCLQVDTSGYITNTGSACGSGGSGGSGDLPLSGGTLTGALNGTSASFSGNLYAASIEGSAPPVLDIRNPAFAGGAICNGSTDIGPAIQAAITALPAKGGTILIPGNPAACYWANPQSLTWGTHQLITLKVQGQLETGTTLTLPGQVFLVGDGGALGSQFQLSGNTAQFSGPSTTGTLGTAVLGNGTAQTFTPSTMTGLYVGTAITIAETVTCNITTITRSNNQVVASVSPSSSSTCHIPPGAQVTIAGVSDTSFDGTFQVITSDYVQGTMGWSQTAANSISSGGTAVGLNEDNIEDTYITAVTSTTATATFYFPHSATALWGIAGIWVTGASTKNEIKDMSVTSSGTDILLMNTNSVHLDAVGTYASAASGDIANYDITLNGAFNVWIDDNSVANTTDVPWGIRLTNSYNGDQNATGNVFVKDSFVMSGIKLDHEGGGVYVSDTTFEQTTRGGVVYDPTYYWSAVPEIITIQNSGLQDNFTGYQQCYIYQTNPNAGGNARPYAQFLVADNLGTACFTNDYYSGAIDNQSSGGGSYGLNSAEGIKGTRNDGLTMDGELRGINADMAPAVVPYSTLPVITNPSSWPTGTCDVTSGQPAPDGTNTAGLVVAASGTCSSTVETYNVTPANGDAILFGGWIYNPTLGGTTCVGDGGFYIDNFGSSHFQISGSGSASGDLYDSCIVNDWWHPVVAYASINSADGTAGTIRFDLTAGTGAGNADYWMPFMIYIPKSAGIPYAEIMRWRTQLLHGVVPPGLPPPGSNPILAMNPSAQLYWAGGSGAAATLSNLLGNPSPGTYAVNCSSASSCSASPYPATQTIVSGTASLGTSPIASGACASTVTVAASGVTTTDTITYVPDSNPQAVSGYAASSSGSLYILAFPSGGSVNFQVCNNSSASITPGAFTLNWKVTR